MDEEKLSGPISQHGRRRGNMNRSLRKSDDSLRDVGQTIYFVGKILSLEGEFIFFVTKTDRQKPFIFSEVIEELGNGGFFPSWLHGKKDPVHGPANQFGTQIEIPLKPLEGQIVDNRHKEVSDHAENKNQRENKP
jgi:hypothetical protein